MTGSKTTPWAPPQGPDVEMCPAGREWDAVRVPLSLGALALDELGDTTGAVIADPYSARLYWLLPTGTAGAWRLPHVAVLGPACYVAVPPAHRTTAPGLHWRVPCHHRTHLTEPRLLRAALETACAAHLGPRIARGEQP